MNVSKNTVYDVLKVQEEKLPEKDWRWELNLSLPDRNWTYRDVEAIQKKLAIYEDFEFYRSDDILEIRTTDGNIMLEIEGLPNITLYCENEHFENIAHTWYTVETQSPSNINDHYNLNFESVISTQKLTNIDEVSFEWTNVGKYFNQKRHIGYIHKSTGIVYVFEMARRSNDAYQSMKDASLSSENIITSMKVVMTDQNILKKGTERTKELLKHTIFLYQEIMEEPYPLVKSEQSSIIQKYMTLISAVRNINKHDKKPFHLAPKPVTLERKNLIDPDIAIGTTSVLKNYAVTDKADGERMLLYIDDAGDAYFINSIYQVKKLGIKAISNSTQNVANSLLDGEYISHHLLNDADGPSIFAIFDIYFIGGVSVMDLPLMTKDGKPSRYEKITLISNKNRWNLNNAEISIEMKEHIPADGKEMFKTCAKILNAKDRQYKIDGLVFTPVDIPVFAYYPNEFKKLKGRSVAWEKVFKWKPPEQNTIDFLVKELDGTYTDTKTNKQYKRFQLLTGYNASQSEEIQILDGLNRIYAKDPEPEDTDKYEARPFKPLEHFNPRVSTAFIPINMAGQSLSTEGEIIEDNTIVEMSFTPDPENKKHASLCWTANRVREDKTKAYRTTGEITKTANDLSVALNIWHSIHAPVTREHIIGQRAVPISAVPPESEDRSVGTNDVYYARSMSRNHLLSVSMLNFHNHGIKSMLYGTDTTGKDRLLELACGMAGDLPRWRDNRFKFILGVDLVKNNIVGTNGSYSRFLSTRNDVLKRNQTSQYKLFFPKAVFVVGDCSLPLDTGDAAKGKDHVSENLLKYLYLNQKRADDRMSFTKYNPVSGLHKFDMVSCQFAIHYFFSDESRLDGFLLNVSNNLKPNGRFITTFMDGQKVNELITKSGGSAVGKKGDREDIVWAIQKTDYKSFNEAHAYNKKINVYLENTSQFIAEYLVHFNVLCKKARQYGLECQSDGFFEETFKTLLGKVKKNELPRNEFIDADILSMENDTVQKQFSFLNRWAIFRKMEKSELIE